MKLPVILSAAALLAIAGSAKALTYNQTIALTSGTSNAIGAANVNVGVDTATHTLSWNVVYSGLSSSLTDAGLFAGGSEIVDFGASSSLPTNPAIGSFSGTASVTTTEVNQIIGGDTSLILETQNNPGGELTGALPALPSNNAVPEPAAIALLGLATAALTLKLGRRR